MALLQVLSYPDPFLKNIATPVDCFDEELKSFLKDMADTMYDSVGIGLAAIQVGSIKRMFVMDLGFDGDDDTTKDPLFLINPVIIEKEGEQIMEEGCLSVPDYRADVVRAREITLEYQDETGAKKKIQATGLTSVCIQHELDHLDGVLFIDHLSPLRRKMIQKKLKKLAQTS
ncbi:MAG: peptide deformylase [SAR324 cluster bacterium]|nr:peptide deformylase [SAR324 cluster bacterium]